MKNSLHYISCFSWMMLMIASVLTPGCSGEPAPQVHLVYTLPECREIEILSVFDVDIRQGEAYQLEVIGPEDVAEAVEYSLQGDTLRIINTFGSRWLQPGHQRIRLIITFKNLERLYAKETCSVNSLNTIREDHFTLTLSGKLNFGRLDVDCNLFSYYNSGPTGGKVEVSGYAHQMRVYIGSLMEIEARDLVNDFTLIETGSKGHVHVAPSSRLDYTITGTGNIYLYSNPAEVQEGMITSTGRLIRL